MFLFKDDSNTKAPNAKADDFLAKAAATNDLLSTISGSIVSIAGTIVPVIIMLAPDVSENVKMTAIGGGMITGGAGAFIARQQPKSLQMMTSDQIKYKSQSSPEGEF